MCVTPARFAFLFFARGPAGHQNQAKFAKRAGMASILSCVYQDLGNKQQAMARFSVASFEAIIVIIIIITVLGSKGGSADGP